MACTRCEELRVAYPIRSAGELSKAIRVIHANLDDGTIEQVCRRRSQAQCDPARQIPDEGPWDDYMLYEFRCRSCGARFRFSAETYHGSGGQWLPLPYGLSDRLFRMTHRNRRPD